jgi:hypothetical protein
MKIHMRPPLPPILAAPPPKPPPTAIQLEMQAEELIRIAQQQQTFRKKLYGTRRSRADSGEDEESESDGHERKRRSDRDVDFLA